MVRVIAPPNWGGGGGGGGHVTAILTSYKQAVKKVGWTHVLVGGGGSYD